MSTRSCARSPQFHKRKVSEHMARFVFAIHLLLFCAGPVYPGSRDPSQADLQDASRKAEESLKKAGQQAGSESFLKELNAARDAMGKIQPGALDPYQLPGSKETESQSKAIKEVFSAVDAQKPQESSRPAFAALKPIVLVSLSMPEADIKAIAIDVLRLGGVMAIRGLYNDNLLETTQRLYSISKGDGGGAVIDPTLFQRFGASVVPTFILPLGEVAACTPENCPAPEHIKATGSVSMDYFLERAEAAAPKEAVPAIKRLRERLK